MSRYHHVAWTDDDAKIKSFSALSRAKSTILKIEIEVTDPTRLGMMMTELQEAQRPAPPPPAETRPKPKANRTEDTSDKLALPAPPLQLTYGGRG